MNNKLLHSKLFIEHLLCARDQEKEMQKGKMVVWEALQIAVKRREAKGKGERKDTPIWMQSSKE